MKKQYRLIFVMIVLFSCMMINPVSGQAPPPPDHGMSGNQTSPGATGCPVDRLDRIVPVLFISMVISEFILYRRGRKEFKKEERCN